MSLFDDVSAKFIAQIEKTGILPWECPWVGGLADVPRNATSHRHYNGINVWLTLMERAAKGYDSNRWITFNAARKCGGHVSKGERATTVYYWDMVPIRDDKEDPKRITRVIPTLKTWKVWNINQCTPLPRLPADPCEDPTGLSKYEPIDAAERVVKGYAEGPRITEEKGDRAFYVPARDAVTMPERGQFKSIEGFYSTLFHELVHSTGHTSRLDRDLRGMRRSDYSREELIAEFGATFLRSVARIDTERTNANSTAYIQGWLKALTEDPRALVVAAGRAEKAAKWILGDRSERKD